MGEEDGETTGQAGGGGASRQLGGKWGDDISEKRKVELLKLHEEQVRWLAETGPDRDLKQSPFSQASIKAALEEDAIADDVLDYATRPSLTGAEVYFLSREVRNQFIKLHLEGAVLQEAHLEGAFLSGVYLEGADLYGAFLTSANLLQAHLEKANFTECHLERADLHEAHLEGANLDQAHLNGAHIWGAHLEGARLLAVHLEGADLSAAHLEGANLSKAHLEGRRFVEGDPGLAYVRRLSPNFPLMLPPTDLRLAFLDRATQLTGAMLGDADLGYVRVADTRWGEVNLAVVDWGDNPVLRDELSARAWRPPKSHAKRLTRQERREAQRKQHAERLNLFREATRANRQLAAVLRDQGLNDDADKFAYRAQVLQRTVLRLQGRHSAAFGSWLLDLVSGYGYQPLRSVATYVIVVTAFAAAYCVLGGTHGPLSWNEAIVVSMTAFHGRGFFGSAFQPGDPQAAIAAVEALVGLLIEITFIATFTQRFFAR